MKHLTQSYYYKKVNKPRAFILTIQGDTNEL